MKKLAIPDSWRMVRLQEVADINRKKWTPRRGGPIRYLDLTAVSTPGRLSPPRDLAAEDAPSRARRLVRSGDTLISTVRPYLKGHARIREAPPNLVASTGFAVISPRPLIHRSLIFHHALGPSFAQHLEARMTGQAYPAVRPSDVGSYEFALPLLDEQKAIAEVLDSIDDTIEQTDRVIAATERLRDSLLHELLTNGLPGWHTEWQEHPNLGTIPADWNVVRLGNVAQVKGGTGFPLDRQGGQVGEYPFIKVSDMTLEGNHTRIHYANNYVGPEDVLALRATVFPPGTIVFPKVGAAIATNKKRVLAVPTIIDNNIVGITVVDTGKCDGTFLYHWFQSVDLFQFANVSAVPSITGARLKRENLPLPPLAQQQAIANVLDGVDDSIEETGREKAALTAFKDSIADALLTGRVRVPGHT